ncbi:UNVERIFIED_CONTAM: hypothetical protein RMT77_000573 [Armadillidium vulgare]
MWDDKEISALIDLWEEYLPELSKPRKDRKVFVAIVKKLQKILKRDIPFTREEIQMKLYILRKQYNKNKKKQIHLKCKPTWRFFSKIDKFSRKLHQGSFLSELVSSDKNNFLDVSEENLDENEMEKMDDTVDCIIRERERWSDKEITALIDLWEEYLPELSKPGKRTHIFLKIAKRLQKTLERHPSFTYKDVQMKLYILKKQYSRNKKRHKAIGGNPPSWRYFSRISRFLEQSSNLLSSSSKGGSESSLANTDDKTDVCEAKLAFENMERDVNESLSIYRERIFWTDEEIFLLINIWGEYLPELRGPRKNKPIFIEMAHRLQEILKKDIPFTYKDVEVKLTILKKQYNTNKRRLLKPGCNPPTWRFFQRIHNFFNDPLQNEGYFQWMSQVDSDSCQISTSYGSSASDEVPFPASEEIVTDTEDHSKILTVNGNYNSVWTKRDISALIDVWEECCTALQFPGKKTQIFIEMAKKLQTILKKDNPFSFQDIQIKLNTLKNQYRALKKKSEESGFDPSIDQPSWQFFPRIHEFYGKVSFNENYPQNFPQNKSSIVFSGDTISEEKQSQPKEEAADISENIMHEVIDIDQKAEILSERYKWTDHEISALIDLWEENVGALRSPGRNLQIFLEMAKKLQKFLNKEIPFTYRDIQTKLYSLKSQYGTNKRKQMKDDSKPPAWQFFSRIDKFYRQKAEYEYLSPHCSQTDSDSPSIHLTSVQSSRMETNLLGYDDTPVNQKNLIIEEMGNGENVNAHLGVCSWTADETSVLIDLWEEYMPMLRSPGKSTQALFEIAKTLQKILKRKHPFTYRDVQTKLGYLKSQYRESKRKKKNGCSPIWRFFPRIHKFCAQIPLRENTHIQDDSQMYYDRSPSPDMESVGENDAIMSDEVCIDTPEQVVITCTDIGEVLSLEEKTNEMNKSHEMIEPSSPTPIFRNAIEIAQERSNLDNLKLQKQMYEKMLELLKKQIEREEQRKIERDEREERLKLEKEQREDQLRREREEREEKLKREREEREEREEQRRREWEARSLELIASQKEQMDKLLELLSQHLQQKKQ